MARIPFSDDDSDQSDREKRDGLDPASDMTPSEGSPVACARDTMDSGA